MATVIIQHNTKLGANNQFKRLWINKKMVRTEDNIIELYSSYFSQYSLEQFANESKGRGKIVKSF